MRALIFSLAVVFAAPLTSAGEMAQRSITVAASGFVEAVPDRLTLQVTVKQTAPELAEASREANAISDQVIDAALKAGISKSDIDSSRLSSWPEYDWRANQRHYLGESVQRELVLTIRELDLKRYGKLIASLSALALERIHPPRPGHSNLEELEIDALRAAIRQGKSRATAMADEVDAALGPVLSVEEISAHSPQPRLMRAEMASADAAAAPSFSFAPRRITAQVVMRFAIESP